jgi:Flp pilus assembly pilin Flp
MIKPGGFLQRIWREGAGPSAVEYALWLATLVAGVAVGSFLLF